MHAVLSKKSVLVISSLQVDGSLHIPWLDRNPPNAQSCFKICSESPNPKKQLLDISALLIHSGTQQPSVICAHSGSSCTCFAAFCQPPGNGSWSGALWFTGFNDDDFAGLVNHICIPGHRDCCLKVVPCQWYQRGWLRVLHHGAVVGASCSHLPWLWGVHLWPWCFWCGQQPALAAQALSLASDGSPSPEGPETPAQTLPPLLGERKKHGCASQEQGSPVVVLLGKPCSAGNTFTLTSNTTGMSLGQALLNKRPHFSSQSLLCSLLEGPAQPRWMLRVAGSGWLEPTFSIAFYPSPNPWPFWSTITSLKDSARWDLQEQ